MTDQTKTIQKIRASYVKNEINKFDELKSLDKRVKRPAKTFAYLFGSISALVLGTGMSFLMTNFGSSLENVKQIGVGVEVFGLLLVALTYPIYKGVLNRRKRRYSSRILELSNSLLNN